MEILRRSRNTQRSAIRILRTFVQTGLQWIGTVVVIGAVCLVREDFFLQLALVASGLLLVAIGTAKGMEQLLPSERHSHALRDEVNQFLKLVEQLNTAALVAKTAESATEQQEFFDLRLAMQQAVERMVEVAGKSDAELAEELADSFSTPHKNFESKREQ